MRKFKKLLLYLLVVLGTFVITHEPTTIYFKENLEQFLNINQLVDDDFNDEVIGHKYLESISKYFEDDLYYFNLYLNNVSPNDVQFVEINNKTYDKSDFNINEKDNSLTLYLKDYVNFSEEPYYSVYFESIIINGKNYLLNYQTYVFKEITRETIENSKKSVVSVKAYNDKRETTWGSGVIIFKKTNSTTNNYNYYVLTNHHVVENNLYFYVHFQNRSGNPSSNRSATLLKVSDYNTDLALLSFTSSELIQTLSDDYQFISNIPNEIVVGQPIYTIGSPYGKNISFNKSSRGTIESTSLNVRLENSDVICEKGCNAIKTTAVLAEGSSGGGTFDANGNLVGIHFAGSKNKTFATSIPMKDILNFIAPYIVKKEVQPDFLFFI